MKWEKDIRSAESNATKTISTTKLTGPKPGSSVDLWDLGGRKKTRNYGKTIRISFGRTVTLMVILTACLASSVHAKSVTGTASFYGNGEKLNKRTASGQVFYPSHLTAASYHFPLGTYVSVRSLETGKSIMVLINDKGPNKRLGRLIDLTPAGFKLLGHSLKKGLARVEVRAVKS